MSLGYLSKGLLDKLTGLPSKDTFLKDHIVPATKDDKFNENKCAQCWDEYTEEHPGVKISPCGHIFGRDCLHEMVNGPTGDLCPYCRVELFRRNVTTELVLLPLLAILTRVLLMYTDLVRQGLVTIYKAIEKQPSWLKFSLQFLLQGPQIWTKAFVRHCTNFVARNPRLDLDYAFVGTSLETLVWTLMHSAPWLLPLSFVDGLTTSKVMLSVSDLMISCVHGSQTWNHMMPGLFDHPEDSIKLQRIVNAAFLMKWLIVAELLWPGLSLPFARLAWSVLATVAWR